MDPVIIHLKGAIKSGDPECKCFVCETFIPNYPHRYEVNETEEVIICNGCMKKHTQGIIDTVISMRTVYRIARIMFEALLTPGSIPRIDDVFTAPSNLIAYQNQTKLLSAIERYVGTVEIERLGTLSSADLINVFRIAKNEATEAVLDNWGVLLVNMAWYNKPEVNRMMLSLMQEMGQVDLQIVKLVINKQGSVTTGFLDLIFKTENNHTAYRLILLNLIRNGIIDEYAFSTLNMVTLTEIGIIFANYISDINH